MSEDRKPTISEHNARFRAYYDKHPAWGSLHIVLDDGNIKDADVVFCIEYAQKKGDVEGEVLARILLTMSKTQRRKVGRTA